MTLNELSQLYYMDKLIARTDELIMRLESKLGLQSPSLSDMPRTPGVNDKIGTLVPDKLDALERAKRQRAEYEEAKERITAYIDGIEDLHIRLIFQFRFLDKMSWNEVADAVGGGNTEDSVKKLCYRYLKDSNVPPKPPPGAAKYRLAYTAPAKVFSQSCPECPTCPGEK